MPNEIGDVTTVTVPAPGTAGPGYAVTINAAIEELQARVAQRADNGSIAQMPAGTVKANLTGALANASDVTLAALKTALDVSSGYPVVVEDIGVATTNTGTANELALRTHMTANPGTPYAYQFGPGTYAFAKSPVAGDAGQGSIYVAANMAARRFYGQGRGVTIISYGGVGNFGDWHCFYAVGNNNNLFEVADLTVMCSGITNPDAADQHHLIQVSASSVHGSACLRENVRVYNVAFGACIGAGWRTLGDTSIGNFVQGYAVVNCEFNTAGIGTGSRSCLEAQQGSRYGLYANIVAKGARNSVFDSEITSANGYAEGLIFENCLFDNSNGSTHNVFSLGGSSTPGNYRAVDWVLSNVVTKCGYVGMFHCKNVKLLHCRFEYQVGVNATIDALMNAVGGATPLVTIRGENDQLDFTSCVWRRSTGVVTPEALMDVESFASPLRRTFQLSLTSPTFIDLSITPASAVFLAADVNDCQVRDMRVLTGATTNYTVLADCLRWSSVNATACARFDVDGLTVTTGGGLYNRLVYVAAGAGITLGPVDLRSIDGTGAVNPASASACLVEFDTTTGTLHENPQLFNLRSPAQYTWIASSAAATAVFPVISGSVGARTQKTLESYTTPPNTFALGAPGDLFFYRPTPQTFELWVKRTQTSGAILTRDRNGWGLLTSSTAASVLTAGTTTLSVSRTSDYHAITVTVTDATVTATSKIVGVNWAAVETDENTAETCHVEFIPGAPGVGSFPLTLVSRDNKPVGGDYKISYQVAN